MARRPTYEQMCAEAISSLARRRGSSAHAIAKFLECRYGGSLPQAPLFRRLLSRRLKSLVNNSLLLKNRASFKLSSPVRRRFLSKSRQFHVANQSSPSRSPGASINMFDSAAAVGFAPLCGGPASDQMPIVNVPNTSLNPSSCGDSGISPRKRRRALLIKQVLLSLDSMMNQKAMTTCTHCSVHRRRLRRYAGSLLRPI